MNMRIDEQALIIPDWQPPAGVRALMTTRAGGVSQGPYASLNLGMATGDDPLAVQENLDRLRQTLSAYGQSVASAWMFQVHGTHTLDLDDETTRQQLKAGQVLQADASFCTTPGMACVVRAADCMPVLLAVPGGVAAAHAGWRGLAGGVIDVALQKLLQVTKQKPDQVVAWLGPCIGPDAFEVGDDVRDAFMQKHSDNATAFRPGVASGKWYANLPLLGRLALERAGVNQVYTDGRCTVTQENLFFSYRRDQSRLGGSGRMAACIWLDA